VDLKIGPPERRAPGTRPRAPRPRRLLRPGGGIGPLARWLAAVNLRAARSRIGRRVRERLHAARHYPEHEIPLGRGEPGLDGLRLAFVSDVHAGSFMEREDVCRLCDAIASLEPDLICLGGDLVNARSDEVWLWREGLRRLRAPLGVYAAPGNHEYEAERDLKLWKDVLGDAGVVVLLNDARRVRHRGAGLWIAGVDDLCDGRPDVELALQGVPEEEPIVLLSHHPDLFHEAAHVGVDLMLSGHTHGGQIAPFGRPLPRMAHTRLGLWGGRYLRDGAQLFVGRGAGVTLLPIRIGARAEVPILRLRVGSGC
jgi:hypothetical protein